MKNKRSIFENVGFLVVIGIVAGALGGLAIGIVTGRPSSAAASSASK
jgi:hypothetical protein